MNQAIKNLNVEYNHHDLKNFKQIYSDLESKNFNQIEETEKDESKRGETIKSNLNHIEGSNNEFISSKNSQTNRNDYLNGNRR